MKEKQLVMMQFAEECGAVFYLVYRIGKTNEKFSIHFFNDKCQEIGYNIIDLGSSLMMLGEPREWSDAFLNNPAYEVYPLGTNKLPKSYLNRVYKHKRRK